MAIEIIKYNIAIKSVKGKEYVPLLLVLNNKLYRVNNWHETFKALMFSNCYKANKLENVANDINKKIMNYVIITDKVDEGPYFAKFSPDLYIRVFSVSRNNYVILKNIQQWIGDFELYVCSYDEEKDLKQLKEIQDKKRKELLTDRKLKSGSIKHLVAHINGRVLSETERFYRKIEKEFDNKILIGDIEITDDEFPLLKQYMITTLNDIMYEHGKIKHEKVFAYGMVRVALKYYASKTFWPYIKDEYGVAVPGNYQNAVNTKFKEVVINNHKLYYEDASSFIQNICMHAFVCNKCADQLFDYLFDFWRIDLSRSIENSVDDEGNDLFNILIEEITSNEQVSVQDIMIHTTMALKLNPTGCKNRIRRILKMIDNSYWYDADYSQSNNRIVKLFHEWKSKNSSAFAKELKKDKEGRKAGKGERLLTSPTLMVNLAKSGFEMVLPKQILRKCTEEEHPKWYVSINNELRQTVEPELLIGRSSLFTEQATYSIDSTDLFKQFDLVLKSEERFYYKKTISSSTVRFFNGKSKQIDVSSASLSKDVSFAFVNSGKLKCLNNTIPKPTEIGDGINMYYLTLSEGDIIILPDDHAVSIGKVFVEGIVGAQRLSNVSARYDDRLYEITADRERVFFKTTKNRLNGTSIKVFNKGTLETFGKVIEKPYIEFHLDDSVDDTYGYLIDFHDYIKKNGIYTIELDIPGTQARQYSMCYIKGFSYTFDEAPYLFTDSGSISFPKHLDIVTSDDWTISSDKKTLIFSFDESEKNTDKYVKDRQLLLEYDIGGERIQLSFELPTLYWKYRSNQNWMYEKPEDIKLNALPNNIYVTGNIDLSSAILNVDNGEDLDESEVKINYDSQNNVYYFRMIDLKAYLNKEKTIRYTSIVINNVKKRFLNIVCKSIVKSQSITGDFLNNIIYGHFDIIGSADYMVSIKYKNELIEENIPVNNGEFSFECNVQEGEYIIELYEIEEDDSGFGFFSYLLGTYSLRLKDLRKLSGRNVLIRYIHDRQEKYANIALRDVYVVCDLQLMDYRKDIENDIELYSWKHDTYDTDEMSQFVYYRGSFGFMTYNYGFKKLSDAVVIFDDLQNMSEVIVVILDDDVCSPLLYNSEKEMLFANEDKMTKRERRIIKPIDDDIYKIVVEVKETRV